MPEASPLLSVRDLRVSFGGVHAVRGASFDVAPGSVTALIGPNGAGKTTAFNLITGFIRPDAGRVEFDGHDVSGMRADRIARLGMVRTFQLTRTLSKMKVLENVTLAAPAQPGERLDVALLRRGLWRPRETAVQDEAMQLLEDVGIASHADEYAASLSGGQRKLLELARALMARPKLVMLDEPMAGVNPTLGRRLLDYLDRLQEERGLTILFVEHDMDVVMDVSDRIVVMAEGAVIAEGGPDEIRRDERVIDAYLGAGAGTEP